MKKILCLILALLMLLSLAACGGSEQPAATPEPTACAHDWAEASCAAPESCTLCGETRGEALPHSFGEWSLGESIMSNSCSSCGETVTQVLDLQMVLNSLLEGKWDFYAMAVGEQVITAYEGTPGTFARFLEDGIGALYIAQPRENNRIFLEQLAVTASAVDYDSGNKTLNFIFTCDDGSSMSGYITLQEDGTHIMTGNITEDIGFVLLRNPHETRLFSGTWVCAGDGQLNTLRFTDDGNFTGTLHGTETSGIWETMLFMPSEGYWYTGINFMYLMGEELCYGFGLSLVCPEEYSPNTATELSYGVDVALGYDNGDYSFTQVSEEQYELLTAAHEEALTKLPGNWVSHGLEIYDGSSSWTEAGDFSISFSEDGSFTSNLQYLEDASWSYRGPKIFNDQVCLDYDVVFNGSPNYISVYADGTMGLCYSHLGTYFSYTFEKAA